MKPVNRVEVVRYVVGICHMQVCAVADATDEEILEVCNKENPSGTRGGWAKVLRDPNGTFLSEKCKTGPLPCADYEGRTHFLVEC